ncbi:MAG TPA: sulfatase, partial [Acidobacteriota bacterium]|nr:sulfatase [Acidobacteriota bacterium]
MRRWLILVLVVMFAGSLFAADKPNIILITIDTLRADHLGCYGAKSNASPHIDQLAAKSVIFENAYSVAPITLTSHTTILSGVYPNKHGVRDNAVFAPAPQPLLQESLKSGGYHTAAFVSGAPLLSRFGLTRGFDLYDDDFAGRERTAETTTQRALQWITHQKSPYFVWIHYYDPHAEYQPPASYRERFRNQLYDGEIAFVDDQIGNLLASIHSNAIILITADHGESLGEHGEKTHAVFLYNATLRVPLILFSPGIKPGRRPEPVSLVDIAPTLREAAGLSAAESDGVSLNKPSADRSLYAESLYAQRNF